MKLSPNVASDRSWVWNVSADVSDGEPEAQTFAIRFANSDRKSIPVRTNLCSAANMSIRCKSLQGGVHHSTARQREAFQQ